VAAGPRQWRLRVTVAGAHRAIVPKKPAAGR
jgi:hypothetical protein